MIPNQPLKMNKTPLLKKLWTRMIYLRNITKHKMKNRMYWLNTPDKILQNWNTLEWLSTKYTRRKPSHSLMKNWKNPSNTPCSWATKTEIICNVSWSILKYHLILLLGLWSKYTIWLWEREKVLTNNTSYRKDSQIWRPLSENIKKLSIPTSQKILLQTNWYIIID